MLKKKVLLFGKLGDIGSFFGNSYVHEYDPVAIVTDNAKILKLVPRGNFPKIDVIAPKDVPDCLYEMVDGVVLIGKDNRHEDINFLLQRVVEARKIIPWAEHGSVEVLTGQQNGTAIALFEGLEFNLRGVGDQKFVRQIRQMLQNQKRFFAFEPQSYPYLLAHNYQAMMRRPLHWNNLQTCVICARSF